MLVMVEGPKTRETFLDLVDRFHFGGKQIYDANIVANMLAHDVTRLLLFNSADFRRFTPLIEIIEP